MQFYKKKKTGKTWQKNPIFSLLHFIRDAVIFILPVRRVPSFLVKALYGVKPKFVFFVHPRRTEDIYTGFPPAVLLRKILGKKIFLRFFYKFPPFVLSSVKTPSGIDGLVISSPFLPENFFRNKRDILKEAFRGFYFGSKLVKKNAVFGLGGLWPMVTRRGIALNLYAKKNGVKITNGHSGTLLSLFLTIKKMADVSNIKLNDLKILILGVGKMGENLARLLYGKVATITLVDINENRLNLVEKKLKETMTDTDIQKYTNKEDFGELEDIFRSNHIAVCTTSNIKRILKPQNIPENCIIIDDSRPEGIPRDLEGDRVVVEGGLMKINGLVQQYDFGFGIDENVFGCLAESFLLAADPTGELKPTLGEVDFENLNRLNALCEKANVEVGDFKCRDAKIEESKVFSILKNKKDLASTIPFKNICWIFNINDLVCE